jgi:hypothetical protein
MEQNLYGFWNFPRKVEHLNQDLKIFKFWCLHSSHEQGILIMRNKIQNHYILHL